MNIAFIVPYPRGKAPSQRFRFEQQLENLEKNNVSYEFYPFLSDKAFDNLYNKGEYFSKTINIVISFIRRFLVLFRLVNYDFIFLHREASPIGPPVFEWLIAKVLRKKIIYDFDDAIWMTNTSSANKIVSKIKWHNKVKSICKWSYKISCGNDFLANFAKKYNKKVEIIPTTVDMEFVHNKTKYQKTDKIVIGWTGTHSTIIYLYDIEKLLAKLQAEQPFEFYVISNKDPEFQCLKYKYTSWKENTEIEDLLEFNIGIMPLKDDKWAKGKCGFKAIQYMSLGIPAVVSNVGVNSKIVDDCLNGFVCNNNTEWIIALQNLITKESLRIKLGKNAKEKIAKSYSKKAIEKYFLRLFNLPSINI